MNNWKVYVLDVRTPLLRTANSIRLHRAEDRLRLIWSVLLHLGMRLHLGGNSHIEDGCLFKQKEEVDICVILMETLYIYICIDKLYFFKSNKLWSSCVTHPKHSTEKNSSKPSHHIFEYLCSSEVIQLEEIHNANTNNVRPPEP